MPHAVKFKADAMRTAQLTKAMDNPVYKEIARRLANCNPPVILDDHIAKILRISDTTLDGVNFVARDYKKLKKVLIDAKDGAGSPFFAHATLEDLDHWALKASFMATDGTGFREIFRLKIAGVRSLTPVHWMATVSEECGGSPARSPKTRRSPIFPRCTAQFR
jgi:hypothetical protein